MSEESLCPHYGQQLSPVIHSPHGAVPPARWLQGVSDICRENEFPFCSVNPALLNVGVSKPGSKHSACSVSRGDEVKRVVNGLDG